MAWATTSPSEWPSQPAGSSGQCSPASHMRRPEHERVDVDADADAGEVGHRAPPYGAQHGLGQQQVERAGHLERLVGAGTTSTVPPSRSTRPASSVAARVAPSSAAAACAASSTPRRKPCGVWTARSAARSTVAVDDAVAVRPLHGVGDRQARDDGVGAGTDGRDDRLDERDRRERAGRVVDEDDVDVRRAARASAQAYGLLARSSPPAPRRTISRPDDVGEQSA